MQLISKAASVHVGCAQAANVGCDSTWFGCFERQARFLGARGPGMCALKLHLPWFTLSDSVAVGTRS